MPTLSSLRTRKVAAPGEQTAAPTPQLAGSSSILCQQPYVEIQRLTTGFNSDVYRPQALSSDVSAKCSSFGRAQPNLLSGLLDASSPLSAFLRRTLLLPAPKPRRQGALLSRFKDHQEYDQDRPLTKHYAADQLRRPAARTRGQRCANALWDPNLDRLVSPWLRCIESSFLSTSFQARFQYFCQAGFSDPPFADLLIGSTCDRPPSALGSQSHCSTVCHRSALLFSVQTRAE